MNCVLQNTLNLFVFKTRTSFCTTHPIYLPLRHELIFAQHINFVLHNIFQSIQSMMIDVNPDTPGNPQALLLYRTNLDKFFHHAEKWTKKYAMQNNVIQQIRNTLSLASSLIV
jgi:hypothetical protein